MIGNLILEVVFDLLAALRDGGDAEAVQNKVRQRLVDAINDLNGIDAKIDAMWQDLRDKVPTDVHTVPVPLAEPK